MAARTASVTIGGRKRLKQNSESAKAENAPRQPESGVRSGATTVARCETRLFLLTLTAPFWLAFARSFSMEKSHESFCGCFPDVHHSLNTVSCCDTASPPIRIAMSPQARTRERVERGVRRGAAARRGFLSTGSERLWGTHTEKEGERRESV